MVRAPWDQLTGTLEHLDVGQLRAARAEAHRLLADDGVTYRPRAGRDRSWHLDPIPMVIGEDEWATIEVGVQQRAELLNLVLADIYGPQELIRSGALPAELVYAHPGYLRALHGVRHRGLRQLVTCTTDLVRDANGTWRALADRTQSPSGAAYALANRSAMARVLTGEQTDAQVLRLAPYLRALRSGLRRLSTSDDPRVVVLTSGSEGETSYEHAALAAALGVPLVEGEDLAVRKGRLKLRSLDKLEPIDVVLRRVDADWCDPLELRPDSTLGVPGMVEAARRGKVAIANPLGSPVLENAGLVAFLPALSKQLLGQDLHLATPQTWWCGDPDGRAHVEANLESLVLKPISRTQRYVAGWTLTEDRRRRLLAQIADQPHAWVGQEALGASTVPSLDAAGQVIEAAAVLRTFVVADDDGYVAMAGGLTRVDSPEKLVITNASGAWSKDTWIVSSREEPLGGFWFQEGPAIVADRPSTAVPVRTADDLVWFGRHAERAEALVRLLRVIDDRRTDFGGVTGPVGAQTVELLHQALAEITATVPGTDPRDLVVDGSISGSLAHSIAGLIDNATAVRDRLSGDTWPVTNALRREVLDPEPAVVDPFGRPTRVGLGRVLTGLLALQGLGAESLERDPTWAFIEVGRRIERGLQLIALLKATLREPQPAAVESLLWESLLTTAESIITYRRRYRSRAQLPTLLDLLLLDDGNPRSLTWQLNLLVEGLRVLPDHPGKGKVGPIETIVLEAATAIRTADSRRLAEAGKDGRRSGLESFLDHLRDQLRAAADLLFRTSLAPTLAPRSTLAPSAPAATGTAATDTRVAPQ